jgi:molybdenum cofactor synthesis domain-containing protein
LAPDTSPVPERTSIAVIGRQTLALAGVTFRQAVRMKAFAAPLVFAVTAAVLAIGDELLSGRTRDKNIGYIADYLTGIGVDLCEARMVADDEAAIGKALNELRASYTYVFTTGGIGPTHDDITADAVARAFGVAIGEHPEALRLIRERYAKVRGLELNAARRRMARIPEGGELIANSVSGAPGFRIGNVFVMAGVPVIMQAMMDEIGPRLKTGRIIHSRTVRLNIPEGDIADVLARIQETHEGVSVGSYPYFTGRKPGTNIVLRCRDETVLAAAADALVEAVGPEAVLAEEE